MQSQINILSHPQPLIRKDEPLVLFIGSAAPISFSTAFFRMHCIARRRDLWRMQRIAGIDEDSDTRQAWHELTQRMLTNRLGTVVEGL